MPRSGPAFEIVPVEDEASFWDDRAAVLTCLSEPTPRIPPWFGYDKLGSELFELITELPTYYLTRVERGLLHRHATEIAELIDCGRIAELGSGSAKKTRLLLAACTQRRETTYLPIDVSREMLETSGAALQAALPGLHVTGVWGRYEAALGWLRATGGEPVVIAFLGSNLGNTTPEERHALLADIAATLHPGDGFLVSVDLQKPGEVFETCYNDPPGRSAFAQFRLNYLNHLNRRFDADFKLTRYHPRAHYDHTRATVEGHLEATEEHHVAVPGLGHTLHLHPGDTINVGFSAKFGRRGFIDDLATHGLRLHAEWIDPDWDYGIFLFRPV